MSKEDILLLETYMKGFNDELKGVISIIDTHLLNAYNLGRYDAFCGDDNPSLDYQTNEEIVIKIKQL